MLAAITAALLSAAHPSLYFGAGDVAALRQKAQTSHASIANHITQILSPHLSDAPFTTSLYSSDPRFYGGHVMAFAFAWQMTGDARYAAQAKTQLFQLMSWTDWGFGEGTPDLNRATTLMGAAFTYDWLWDYLSATERSQVQARIASEAQQFSTALPTAWWNDQFLENHHWIDTASLGLAGLVLQGEDTRAAGWLATATQHLGFIQQSIDPIADGSFHEGSPYLVYGLSHALPFWMALAHAGDDRTNVGLLRGFGRHRLATAVPDAPRQQLIPHGDFTGWPSQGTLQVLRYTAAKFKDTLAEAAAQQWIAAGTRSSFLPELWYEVFEFLAYDPSVAAAPQSQWPLDAAFTDQQSAVLKSSLSPGDLQVGFKAAPYGGRAGFDRMSSGGAPTTTMNWGHDHNDDLSFWIYGLGQWLAPEAAGYTAGKNTGVTNPANVTAYHNSLLVDGQGELGDVRASDSEWNNPWFWKRDARVLVPLLVTDDYSASGGRGAALFDAALGLSRWDRLVVLARHRYVVVRDDLMASASHSYEWLCHFADGATPDSTSGWITGQAKNSKRLAVRMVSPASWTATTGSQTASLMSKFDSDGSTAYVRVKPATDAANQQFLALLFPQDVNATRPTAQALSSQDPGAGAVVQPGTALEERWIFSRVGSDGKAAGDLALTGALAGMAGRDSSGAPVRSVLLSGPGKLSDQSGGRELLSSTTALSIEADLRGDTLAVSGQNILDFRAYAPSAARVTLNGRSVSAAKQGDVFVFPGGPASEPDAGPAAGTGGSGGAGGTSPDAGTPGSSTDGGAVAVTPDGGTGPNAPVVESSVVPQGCGGCSGGADVGFGVLGLFALLRRRSQGRKLPPSRPLC